MDKTKRRIYGWESLKYSEKISTGAISESNKYEDKIKHIEISHARTRTPKEPLAEAEQAILRSELEKLMRIARIARPGAIYDASAAAQTFSDGELRGVLENGGGF